MSEVEVLKALLKEVLTVFEYKKVDIRNNDDAKRAARLRKEIKAALENK